MRLIDADAFIQMMEEKCDPESTLDPWVLSVCRGGVKMMPTVDAVPVVRCKDCKHYQFADNRAFGFPVKLCEWTGFEDVDDEDFCSRGERKDGEHHDNNH